MIKIIILLIAIFGLSSQITMKLFDKADDYILTPEDYDYKDSIIIEMWGAGSGSSQYVGENPVECPGSSGAYIKMKINTVDLNTFYFHLGKGGNSTTYNNINNIMCSNTFYIGYNGESSTFYLPGGSLNVKTDGGYAYGLNLQGNGLMTPPISNVSTLVYRPDDFIINKSSGVTNQCQRNSCNCALPHYASPAPFGYMNAGCVNNKYPYDCDCDGYMGSGSNYYCNIPKQKDKNGMTSDYFKGGDGALILYY